MFLLWSRPNYLRHQLEQIYIKCSKNKLGKKIYNHPSGYIHACIFIYVHIYIIVCTYTVCVYSIYSLSIHTNLHILPHRHSQIPLSSQQKQVTPIITLYYPTQSLCPLLHFLNLCIGRDSIHDLIFLSHVHNT